VWIALLDRNSLIEIWQYKKRINNLKEERKFYIEKIVEDSTKLKQLHSKKMIEKFARERYFMKAPDEDVYVIIEEE
jgi:cell division protein FtsB